MGIVHIGIRSFHRAHQAVYTNALLSLTHENWKITEASLRSENVKNALAPQG